MSWNELNEYYSIPANAIFNSASESYALDLMD